MAHNDNQLSSSHIPPAVFEKSQTGFAELRSEIPRNAAAAGSAQ